MRGRGFGRAAGPLACVLAFVLAMLYPLTVLGRALYWGDLFLYFTPMEQVVRDTLRQGRLPLWNPYILCGQPLVGNPQAWVFYPATVLLTVMPVWLYWTASAVLHLSAAALGAYLFLRRLCGDRAGALLGAIAYGGSGFLVARLQFPPMAQACAYLPWLLLTIDRVIDRPGVGYAALLASVIALETLAAHAQIAYMTFLCGALYVGARLWQARRHRRRIDRAVALMAYALIVGVAAASVQALPTLQLVPHSTREQLTFLQANRFVLRPAQLLNFLWPNFYGNPADSDFWGSGNMWEPCVYMGLLPLGLAAYALVRAPRRPAARFFAVLAVAAVWLATGRFGGLFWVAYYAVPGVRSFHDPARFAFLATFAIAALAATGMRLLRRRGVPRWARAVLVLLAAADLGWFSSRLSPTIDPALLSPRPMDLGALPRPGEGRVFTVQDERVWKWFVSYLDYGPATARYATGLAASLIPNIGMGYRLEDGSGYEPVGVRAADDVDALAKAAFERQGPGLSTVLRLCNARVVLLPAATRYPCPSLSAMGTRGTEAFAVRDPQPRAWLVRETRRVDGAQRALAVLGGPEFDPRQTAVVSGSAGLGDGLDSLSGAPRPVRTLRVTPSLSEFAADAGTARAFLVWSATWYPGWHATMDGEPVLLERANRAFCGVTVPAGRHVVRFTYEPFVFRLGLYISLAAGTLIAAGLSYGVLERRQRHDRVS